MCIAGSRCPPSSVSATQDSKGRGKKFSNRFINLVAVVRLIKGRVRLLLLGCRVVFSKFTSAQATQFSLHSVAQPFLLMDW